MFKAKIRLTQSMFAGPFCVLTLLIDRLRQSTHIKGRHRHRAQSVCRVVNMTTETNVNMTFYDSFSKSIKYNFIHTINHRGNPDTIPLDPVLTYDLTVHTLPEVSKSNIKIYPGKHNIIALDAPQGYLQLQMSGLNEYDELKSIDIIKNAESIYYLRNDENELIL